MDNVIARFVQYQEAEGLSDYRVTADAGLSNGQLGNAKKSAKGGLNSATIEKILLSYPNLNPTWLMTGKGTMKVSDVTVKSVKEPERVYRLKTDKVIEDQSVPLYDLEATAGMAALFQNFKNESEPVDYITIPNLPKCDGAIKVTGDSMYPLLKSGDIVMYKKVTSDVDNIYFGEMYLLSVDMDGDEYVTVKWVQKSDRSEEHIRLVSENRHHPPKDVHLSKVRGLALIKASIRINSMV